MRNRYGDKVEFKKVGKYTFNFTVTRKNSTPCLYWRFGAIEGSSDYAFADPSGGPFIGVGFELSTGNIVERIYRVGKNIRIKIKE